MGLLIAIARKVQLTSMRFDYEQKQISLNQAKSDLASKITDYQSQICKFDKNDTEYQIFDERIKKLSQIEKKLDEQIARIQLQLQLIEAEYGNCDRMIQSNIQSLYGR